jgi:hypothetical protein
MNLGETILWNCIARPALRLPALPFYVTWLVSRRAAKTRAAFRTACASLARASVLCILAGTAQYV